MWLRLLIPILSCLPPSGLSQMHNPNEGYHWGTWSSLPLTCSVTCGRGLRCRVRKCLDAFGKVQTSTERCSNPEDYESKAESCTVCVVHSRCPNIAGWGEWGSWTSCIPRDTIHQQSTAKCQEGIRTRHRICNNPPPEPPPFGIPCVGQSSQASNCSYNCEEDGIREGGNIALQVQLQFEKDYIKGLKGIRNVLRKRRGQLVRLSCDTPAHRLAKGLTVPDRFTAAKMSLRSKVLRVQWYKNGKIVHLINPYSKITPTKGKASSSIFLSPDPLSDEEHRWENLLPSSLPQLEDSDLVFTSVQEGDSGFYTCELTFGEYKWLTVFYSLVIVGVRYSAQQTDPFYLHSNLGHANSLEGLPVWFEASQIVWMLNGAEFSRGLTSRPGRRIQQIKRVNMTHRGFWQCFLLVPAVGPISVLNSPNQRVARRILLSEFELTVHPTLSWMWSLGEHPKGMRILRNTGTALWLLCNFLVLFLLLTIWAAKRWITRSLSAVQKKALVQEILDNHCRLMLTARKRAAINKERLFPLILQEHQRLETANRHLAARLMETNILEEDGAKAGKEDGKLSLLERSATNVAKIIRGMGTRLMKRAFRKAYQPSVRRLSKVSALSFTVESSARLRNLLAKRKTKAPGSMLDQREQSMPPGGRQTRRLSEATRSRISIASAFGRLSGISTSSFLSLASERKRREFFPDASNFSQRAGLRSRSEGPTTTGGLKRSAMQ
ncbi:unnamed protein product [Dicrocoelium dendriticum]|nr:unnamed protein product [Dicrocoelium dendriticum]